MTDLALVRRWTERRDAEAFKEIVSRYAPMVYATCTRILGNRTEAEDVTQECFEKLSQTAQGPVEHLGAWLHRVATNRALDRVRSEQRRKTREASFVAEQPSHVESGWDDVYVCVDEAIAELPEELRVAVVAHYLQGQSHGEIARATSVPRRTVSNRIVRAVELIGESLRKRGVRVASGALAVLMAVNLAKASTLPPSVTAALGKLALAHSANVSGAAAPAAGTAASAAPIAAKLIGGVLVMKKSVAAIVFIVAALAAFWVVRTHEPSGLKEKVSEAGLAAQNKTVASNTPQTSPSSPGVESAAAKQEAVTSSEDVAQPAITGIVVDADTGEGVPGATVSAVEGGSNQRQASQGTTGKDGRFEVTLEQPGTFVVLKNTGPGDYTVTAPEDMVEVTVRDGQRKEGVQIKARKGGTVSGKVTDKNGTPVAGAKLTVYPARNESFQGARAAMSWDNLNAESDAAGEYVLRGLKPGRSWVVLAGADGFIYDRSAEFSLNGNDVSRRIDFKLSRGSAISGWVQDRRGTRLTSEAVMLEIAYDQGSYADDILKIFAQGRTQGAKTDDKGAFRIEGLPAGTYHLMAGGFTCPMRRFDGAGVPVTVDGTNSVEGILVTAHSLGQGDRSLAGHVVDAQGAGIAGAAVCIAPRDVGGMYSAETDAKGAFVFDGLAADVSLLSATAPGYTQEVMSDVPADGQDITITLEKGAPIRGRVLDRDNGKSVAGVRVSIAEHERRRAIFEKYGYLDDIIDGAREDVIGRGTERTTTGKDGVFELANVDPGRVKLKAERAGYAASFTDEFEVTSGHAVEDVTIYVDRGATVEGVVKTTNGAPVEGASILVIDGVRDGETERDVDLRLVRATNDGQGGAFIRAISDAGGRFVAEGFADGTYWFRAIAVGYAYSPVVEVAITNETPQGGVELTLDPGGAVEGYVTVAGVPKSDILAQVNRSGVDSGTAQIYSNEQGYYVISHLAPGEWELRFVDWSKRDNNTGLKIFQIEIASGETTRQDVDYSGSTVGGMVSGLDEPAGWQVAVLRLPDGVDPEAPPDPAIDWPSLAVGMTYIGPTGEYAIGGIPDGVYKVTVFTIQDDRIVVKNLWQTIAVAGEDLVVDLAVAEDMPVNIPVPE